MPGLTAPLRALYGRAALAGILGGGIGVAGLALARAATALAENAAFWLPYPYSRPGSEGLMLYETLLLRRGESLYGPITPERFISGPYPPIYYLLAGWVMPPDAVGFTEGRTISLWSALIVAAALVLLVILGVLRPGIAPLPFKRTPAPNPQPPTPSLSLQLMVGAGAGLVAALAWLAQPPVLIWATRFRADMLMMAFTALGLLACAWGTAGRDPARPLHPATWLAVPLFALAVFTKQTALAGPLAVGLFLLLRRPRTAILWGVGLGLAVGVPFLLLDLATDHGFYLKMVVYHRLPYSLLTLERLVAAFWEDHAGLIVLGGAYTAWRLIRGRLDLAACMFLATLALLPTAGVVGADSNHLLFSGLAVAWTAAAALAALVSSQWSVVGGQWSVNRLRNTQHATRSTLHVSRFTFHVSRFTLPATILTLALLLGYAAQVAAPAGWYGADLRRPTAAEQEQWRLIVANVRATPGRMFFADDPGVLALAGKDTDYDDPFTMTALAPTGLWDPGVFERRLRAGEFPLVLLAGDAFSAGGLRADVLTPGMREALAAGYVLLFRDVYFTYAPRRGSR
jgi:hypothetical protein